MRMQKTKEPNRRIRHTQMLRRIGHQGVESTPNLMSKLTSAQAKKALVMCQLPNKFGATRCIWFGHRESGCCNFRVRECVCVCCKTNQTKIRIISWRPTSFDFICSTALSVQLFATILFSSFYCFSSLLRFIFVRSAARFSSFRSPTYCR